MNVYFKLGAADQPTQLMSRSRCSRSIKMKLNNVCSVFLSGDSVETILFKCALYWAEFGEPVWFISPTPFKTLPNGWTKPSDKEILKLIYFIYIPETKDLLIKLSDVHLLPKIPKTIIVMEIDHYLFPPHSETNFTSAAFVISSLLDSTSVFSAKFSSPSYLISSCKNVSNSKLQTIIDLYFTHNYNVTGNTYKDIEEVFKNYEINR